MKHSSNSGFAAVYIILLVVVIGGIGAYVYFNKPANPPPVIQKVADKRTVDTFDETTETPTLITPAPTVKPTPVPTSSVPAGWSTYKNSQYGFEISYPDSYKAQSSKDDLYGYPKGVLLLYSGGQAYDVVIEVWNSQKEYEDEYQARVSDLKVFKSGAKFITVLDNDGTPENKAVIDSFKLNQ